MLLLVTDTVRGWPPIVPRSKRPVTVPVLTYWPLPATPVLVHSTAPVPTGNVAIGQTRPCLSSATTRSAKGTLPVFVTTYVHLTGPPASSRGPGAVWLSMPLVVLTIATRGSAPK